MPRPKQHDTGGRPCGGLVRAIYTRQTDSLTRRVRWVSMGWLCDRCHKWAEFVEELT